MPTLAHNAAERRDAEMMLELHRLGAFDKDDDDSSSGDSDFGDALLIESLEPLARPMRTGIGPARLSLERVEAEASTLGDDGFDRSAYLRFGFRAQDLRTVVEALDMPKCIRLPGHHVMRGEEAVLITLRRFRTPGDSCARGARASAWRHTQLMTSPPACAQVMH
jgi:hypothetical protein